MLVQKLERSFEKSNERLFAKLLPSITWHSVHSKQRSWNCTSKMLGTERGLGLVGMQERAQLAGGTFEIESAPGVGTTIYAQVPLAASNPDVKEDQAR